MRAELVLVLGAQADMRVIAEAGDGHGHSRSVAASGPTWHCWTSGCPSSTDWRSPAGSWPNLITARVVMLTTFDLDSYLYEALELGVSGFFLKDDAARAARCRHPRRDGRRLAPGPHADPASR